MLKKFFSKNEDGDRKDESKSAPAARPKIVIKQRRPSNAPVPNNIANAMSANSMQPDPQPRRDFREEPQERHEPAREELHRPPAEQQAPQPVEVDTSIFENRITELKEENKALHAALDKLEKSKVAESQELQATITKQKSNYAALEDEFLKRKDDIDELKKDLQETKDTLAVTSDELQDLQMNSVDKFQLQDSQTRLREESKVRSDLETQVSTLRKDQARYESMVTELSTHISELKDSLDKSSEAQFEKLIEVKDQEIERNGSYIQDLEKQVKELHTERSKLKDLVNQKDTIIDQSQEFETQLIDAENIVQDLEEKLEALEVVKLSLEDKLTVQTADIENFDAKAAEYETKINALQDNIDILTDEVSAEKQSVKDTLTQLAELDKKYQAAVADKQKMDIQLTEASGSNTALKATMESSRNKVQEAEKEIERLKAELKIAGTQLEALDVNHKEGSSQLESLQKENIDLKDSLKSLTDEISTIHGELRTFKENDNSAAMSTELEVLRTENTSLTSELESAKEQVQSLVEDETTSHLIDQITALTDSKNVMEAELVVLREQMQKHLEDTTVGDLEASNNELKQQIQALEASISEAKAANVEVEEVDVTNTEEFTKLQAQNDELVQTAEKLHAKISELEKALANSVAQVPISVDTTELDVLTEQNKNLEAKLLGMQGTLDHLEAENAELKEQAAEHVVVPIAQESQDEAPEEQEPVADGVLQMNLVMKPDNDEYDLELPLNMTGKEIKAELTEAGLLEEGMSYDLFFPRIDKLLMNKELLSACKLQSGETMEIIPGGM